MARKPKGSLSLPALPAQPRERENVGRSTIKAAQARRALADSLPGSVYQPRKRGVAALSASSPSPTPSAPTRKPPPREDRPLDLKPLPDRTCKTRPASSRGSGGSRPFVPWCSRR